MNINKQNIPKNWQIRKLCEICDVRDGTHSSPKFVDNGFPLITSKNLVDGKIDYDNVQYITQKDYIEINKRSNVEDGDILLAMIGTIGKPVLVKKTRDFSIKNVALFKVGQVNNVLNNIYLYNYLSDCVKELIRKASGGTQKFVGLSEFRSFEILLPPIEEQKKIAEILGTWDRAIEELTDLIAEKKELKRGLMQRLLTGTQRLPGFYDDWEHEMLGNMVNISSAGSKSQYIEESGRYLIVDMGAVSNEARIIAKKQTNYTHDFLSCGDIVMPKDDIGGGNIIGKTVVIDADNKYILGDHVFKLRIKNTYEAKFISNLINSFLVNKYMRRMATGSAQLGLAKRDVEKCVLWLPVGPAEQKAIADVLSKADAEIDLLNQRLDVLKEQKRGLMQKLLTGEIRVKMDVE